MKYALKFRQFALNWLPPILLRKIRGWAWALQHFSENETLTIDRFVFSEESSSLTDSEYQVALELIERVKEMIKVRDSMLSQDETHFKPSANWSPKTKGAFELDGKVTNAFTSSDLLLQGNRDVIRKMRLYSQSFTGYQLATLEFPSRRPWIQAPLPQNYDDLLKMLVAQPDKPSMGAVDILEKLPERLRIPAPLTFGEIGWIIRGNLVNYDIYSYLEELAIMWENGILDILDSKSKAEPLRVLEIGGGYGGLAYYLAEIYPNLEYFIVDIPESLLFSSIYLYTLFSNRNNRVIVSSSQDFTARGIPGFTFVPNYAIDNLNPEGKFTLIINTSSLTEMSRDQVIHYCTLIERLLAHDGLFYEHNVDTYRGCEIGNIEQLIKKSSSMKHKKCTRHFLKYSRSGTARIWFTSHLCKS